MGLLAVLRLAHLDRLSSVFWQLRLRANVCIVYLYPDITQSSKDVGPSPTHKCINIHHCTFIARYAAHP